MKKSLIALPLLAIISTSAFAEVTGNVSVTSDYIFRGLSQTNNQPAVQGGIDYSSESGFYAGTWASNTDFDATGSSGAELDLYAGFTGEVDGFGYDLGFVTYQYPKLGDSLEELYIGFTYNIVGLTYYYDWDNKASYIDGSLGFDINETVSGSVHLGSADFDGGGDYIDYGASISKSFKDMSFTLGLSQTDINGDDLAVYVSWGTEFGF
ncbi:MAG: TorF family putative porin [bacterium]